MSETGANQNKGPEGGGAVRAWPLFVGLPLIVLVAVGAVLLSGGEGGAPAPPGDGARPAGQQRASGEEAAGGDGGGLGTPALGEADAPVVMIEYGDYG